MASLITCAALPADDLCCRRWHLLSPCTGAGGAPGMPPGLDGASFADIRRKFEDPATVKMMQVRCTLGALGMLSAACCAGGWQAAMKGGSVGWLTTVLPLNMIPV